MNMLKTLFTRKKEPTLQEMKLALRKIEMERVKKKKQIEIVDKKASETFDKLRLARKRGEQLQVEWLLNEYKNLNLDRKLSYREARKANLEGITLKNYIRLAEFATKSDKSVSTLINRIKDSKLMDLIENGQITEEEYLSQLEDEIQDLSSQLDFDSGISISSLSQEDTELLNQIDQINELEEKGDFEKVDREIERLTNPDFNKENDKY